MGILGNTFGLPFTGPLRGLGWLARQIAEAASREMADPAAIETELLALERQLNAGDIDEALFEAREAELLALLAGIEHGQSEAAEGNSEAPDAPVEEPPA
jgi:hypothetical protein